MDNSTTNKKCPKCNLMLIDDYWDTVEEDNKGDFTFDAFEAFVCPSRCGYYIRKSK